MGGVFTGVFPLTEEISSLRIKFGMADEADYLAEGTGLTEYLGQTDGSNCPRISDVSEYRTRSALELKGWPLIEVLQTYQTDFGERRQRVETGQSM